MKYVVVRFFPEQSGINRWAFYVYSKTHSDPAKIQEYIKELRHKYSTSTKWYVMEYSMAKKKQHEYFEYYKRMEKERLERKYPYKMYAGCKTYRDDLIEVMTKR